MEGSLLLRPRLTQQRVVDTHTGLPKLFLQPYFIFTCLPEKPLHEKAKGVIRYQETVPPLIRVRKFYFYLNPRDYWTK